MKKIIKNNILFLFLMAFLMGFTNPTISHDKIKTITPEELYGEMFYDIQANESIFSDSKYFVDAVPLWDIEQIRENYKKIDIHSNLELKNFIQKNFELPSEESTYQSDFSSINDHIYKLWDSLKRPADRHREGTLIPLPYPYIVPGGRFREIYYWDSYFTMLGLQKDNKIEIIENMIDNFSYLIDSYGFIPNGNRTYYLSRSQPPFFALMLEVLAESRGNDVFIKYLPSMEKEYEFWMDGSTKLTELNAEASSFRRVVRLPDGEILNRYWDDKNIPRSESYREDIKTANKAISAIPDTKPEEVFRNLRAAAESGWDFSSRWLTENPEKTFNLYTIHTTDILPVDLNSLIYYLEYRLSKTYERAGNKAKADLFKQKYQTRKKALIKYFWNAEKGFFMDFDFKKNKQTNIYSLAGIFPLYFQIADQKQATQVAQKIKKSFLKQGGLIATLHTTDEQWDAPYGWAPLQWLAIKGLKNYGFNSLASEIKSRWLKLNQKVYRDTHKMLEKYNVEDLSRLDGGGEYENQDGFGWTNGVYRKLSQGSARRITNNKEKLNH